MAFGARFLGSFVVLSSLLAFGGCTSLGNHESAIVMPAYGTIDTNNAKAILNAKKQPVIIDVRTPEEFAQGHIKGAKNINFLDADFTNEIKRLDSNKEYLIYCRSGTRSAKAQKVMEANGVAKIYNLDGGYNAWQKAQSEK